MKRVKDFWCYKVLPLVYDSALSYYEVLNKAVEKLNELINWSDDVNNNINEVNENVSVAVQKADKASKDANEAKTIAQSAAAAVIEIENDIPTKTSELTNDSGFITADDVPTKTSELTNDSGFITAADLPTATSELTNDSGFITAADLPTTTSELTNDSGFITYNQVLTQPNVNDAMTTTDLLSLAVSTPSAHFSWYKDGSATYTPTSSSGARWVFDLYTKATSGNSYVYLTAIDTFSGHKYFCSQGGSWIQIANYGEIPTALRTTTGASGASATASNNTYVRVGSGMTIPAGFVGLISASCRFQANSSGYRRLMLSTSSSTSSTTAPGLIATNLDVFTQPLSASQFTVCTFCAIHTGGSTSQVAYLWAYQNSGSSLNVTAAYLRLIRL